MYAHKTVATGRSWKATASYCTQFEWFWSFQKEKKSPSWKRREGAADPRVKLNPAPSTS